MRSTSPTKFREKADTVYAMTWDGSLVHAEYIIKWLQAKESVTAEYISNRFGDACIKVSQPGQEPDYISTYWTVYDDGDHFRVMDPFQFRTNFEPDETNRDHAVVLRLRRMVGDLERQVKDNRASLLGPVLQAYEGVLRALKYALDGDGL